MHAGFGSTPKLKFWQARHASYSHGSSYGTVFQYIFSPKKHKHILNHFRTFFWGQPAVYLASGLIGTDRTDRTDTEFPISRRPRFSYVYECVNFWWILRYVFHMFMGCEFLTKNGWISRCFSYVYMGCEFQKMKKAKQKSFQKKKSDKSDICYTTHPYDIFSQFHELNGWKTGSHSVCLEFDGINSKNVTFIWLNLHAWGLIMSYYGLKWKQI